jgi:DNA-binding NarL/FixJ family response regulator
MRVVIADDALLIREGLSRILTAAGIDVVELATDVDSLVRAVAVVAPDVAIVDVRMPPTFSDEGLAAARRLAVEYPRVGVLVLSQYAEPGYAMSLLEEAPARRGYLLKDRVTDPDVLVGALYRIHAGETVVDPVVVEAAVGNPAARRRLSVLSEREREVLAGMAAGLTDRGICDRLVLSPKTVSTHIAHIFTKLELPSTGSDNRRVHAVLRYLQGG